MERQLKLMNKDAPRVISSLGVTTALVCATTMLFTVYVPATKGFFNMGETMVYLSAILFGPFIGAFAGGVGSMLADLFLGYYYYAPATLIIKASEGFIVGLLYRYNLKLGRKGWKITTSLLGVLVGAILAFVGSNYYSGDIELALGYTILTPHIPQIFWLALSGVVTILIILAGLLMEPEVGWMVLSIMIGGLTMVLGYFLYQAYLIGPLFGIEAIAIAEVPINIGQMIIGLIISVPVARIIKRFFHIR
ncbi:MAG: ECF transporter S component [Candidatus Bathyarchaeia archaeon]